MKKIISVFFAIALLAQLMLTGMVVSAKDEWDPLKTKPVVRFGVISDTHIKDATTTEEARLEKALQSFYQLDNDIDAIVMAGDITDFGKVNQYDKLNEILNRNLKGDTKLITCMGNHDYEGGHARYQEKMNRELNTHDVINGIHFISLSLYGYSSYTSHVSWLAEQLEDAYLDDNKAPIFVIFHYPVKNTLTGSDLWGLDDLYDTLAQYPQVIAFSGHTHYAINDPRAIWQGDFTAVATGTTSYFEMDDPEIKDGPYPPLADQAAQGLIVEVDSKNQVTIRRLDFKSGEFAGPDWVIKKPSDKSSFTYTNERAGKVKDFAFNSASKITFNEITAKSVEFTFDQAEMKDESSIVYSYKISLTKTQTGETVSEYKIWSDYYYTPMPKTLTQKIVGLEKDMDYTVTITAYEAFGKESKNVLKKSFLTTSKGFDFSKPAPVADILDVDFTSGSIEDKSPEKNQTTNMNNVTFGYDEEIKSDVAYFDGQNYIKIPIGDKYPKLNNGITLEGTFKFDEFFAEETCPFSNMQSGGIGFDVIRSDANHGRLEIWANINYQYKQVGVDVETGKWYHAVATYDGNTLALYLNGELAAELAINGSITWPANENAHWFSIGSDSEVSGSNYYTKGAVSSARIYSRALDDSEVYMIYSREFSHIDTMGPSFKFENEPVKEAVLGTKITLEKPGIYDNIDTGLTEYTLSVVAPDGSEVSGETFTCNQLGDYTITYTAKDTKGNEGKLIYKLTVSETGPDTEQNQNNSWWVYVVIGVAGVAIVAIVIAMLKKKK